MMQVTKILVLKENRIRGSVDGIDTVLSHMFSAAQNDSDVEFNLLTNSKSHGANHAAQYCPVYYVGYPCAGINQLIKHLLGLIIAIVKINQLKPDIIIFTQAYQILMLIPFTSSAKIVHYHHSSKPFFRKSGRIVEDSYNKLVWNLSYKFSTLNISVCQEAHSAFLRKAMNSQNILLPNGFPNTLNTQKLSTRLSMIEKHQSVITIIGVGRFNERKGGHDFVKIASHLAKTNAINFIFIGAPKSNADAKIMARHTSKITFLGHSNNVTNYLEDASIALFLSHEEASSLCLREMMSAGLPVVAWDLPGIRDDLQHQKDMLAEFQNFDQLRRILTELLIDKTLLSKRSQDNAEHSRSYGFIQQYQRLKESLLNL